MRVSRTPAAPCSLGISPTWVSKLSPTNHLLIERCSNSQRTVQISVSARGQAARSDLHDDFLFPRAHAHSIYVITSFSVNSRPHTIANTKCNRQNTKEQKTPCSVTLKNASSCCCCILSNSHISQWFPVLWLHPGNTRPSVACTAPRSCVNAHKFPSAAAVMLQLQFTVNEATRLETFSSDPLLPFIVFSIKLLSQHT